MPNVYRYQSILLFLPYMAPGEAAFSVTKYRLTPELRAPDSPGEKITSDCLRLMTLRGCEFKKAEMGLFRLHIFFSTRFSSVKIDAQIGFKNWTISVVGAGSNPRKGDSECARI